MDPVRQLQRWMKSRDLTQDAAALELGLHQTTLSKILTRERSAGIKVAIAIEKAAGIPAALWSKRAA